MASTFTDYFRLMVMHLGLPHWQYAFTDVGLDPVSQVPSRRPRASAPNQTGPAAVDPVSVSRTPRN
jgi:hypothetical protein